MVLRSLLAPSAFYLLLWVPAGSNLVETTPFCPVSEMLMPAELPGHPEWPCRGSSQPSLTPSSPALRSV